MRTYHAHSTKTADKSDWQTLSEHLLNVANLAEHFADAFNAGKWGKYAGMLHDAGKATEAFQKRLEGKNINVAPHTGAWIGITLNLRQATKVIPVTQKTYDQNQGKMAFSAFCGSPWLLQGQQFIENKNVISER